MPVKIKITNKQLKEIVGDDDMSYLDNSDFKEYDGMGGISNSVNLSSGEYGKPVSTDDVSKMLTQQTGYGLMMSPRNVNKYTK